MDQLYEAKSYRLLTLTKHIAQFFADAVPRKNVTACVLLATYACVAATASAGEADRQTAVFPVTQISAQHALDLLRNGFPHAQLRIDASSNTVIAKGSTRELDEIRTVLTGIDVRNPLAGGMSVIHLVNIDQTRTMALLDSLFPQAKFVAGPNHTLIIHADQNALSEIQSLVGSLDVVPVAAVPVPRVFDTVRVDFAEPHELGRRVARQFHDLRIDVAGTTLILHAAADTIEQAKKIISALDHPQATIAYPVMYRPHAYSVSSIAALLRRTFPSAHIEIEEESNTLSVLATMSVQRRIADALALLDAESTATGGTASSGPSVGAVGMPLEIYTLKAALPGANGTPSTSAADLAGVVTQALAAIAPDLHITVVPMTQKLILTGSPYSVATAKALLDKLDVVQDLVVLDIKILEVDETDANDLGLSLPTPVIATTFSETAPVADQNGVTPRLARLQPIQRTALSLPAQLSLLLQRGKARVLADPHITTVSGRTATIRAGDTISVQTTAGGGAGTVATTQLQTFQTGVSLDITPVVNADNFVTVTLHPTVNSETGILNGIPQIATRDTQTTVALREDQTLIIGGLIQDTSTTNINKIPVLSNIPLVGRLFQENQYNHTRDELVVTVTPHILKPQARHEDATSEPLSLPDLPAQTQLNLPPDTQLPPTSDLSPSNGALLPGAAAISNTSQLATSVAASPSPNPVSTLPSPMPSVLGTAVPGAASTIAPGDLPLGVPANPAATPLASVNRFVYGTPPQNNFARSGDPLQIYYVTLSPTVVKAGDTIAVSAVTSSNTQRVAVMLGSASTNLSMTAPGQWSGSLTLGALSNALPQPPAAVSLTLQASQNTGGSTASVPIPVNLLP